MTRLFLCLCALNCSYVFLGLLLPVISVFTLYFINIFFGTHFIWVCILRIHTPPGSCFFWIVEGARNSCVAGGCMTLPTSCPSLNYIMKLQSLYRDCKKHSPAEYFQLSCLYFLPLCCVQHHIEMPTYSDSVLDIIKVNEMTCSQYSIRPQRIRIFEINFNNPPFNFQTAFYRL